MFDCVLPTRLGRHGTLLTDAGRLNIKRAEFATQHRPRRCRPAPVRRAAGTSGVTSATCAAVGEQAGATLCTIHNLTWILGLVGRTDPRRRSPTGTLDDAPTVGGIGLATSPTWCPEHPHKATRRVGPETVLVRAVDGPSMVGL